jgi:hypothetical protein
MKQALQRSWALGIGTAVFAAALILLPASSIAQESRAGNISKVTELYSLEGLLPVMSSGEIGSTKDISAWCLDMARSFKDRLADAQKQVDLQREAKRAEIRALEARTKSAGKAKDEETKRQLAQEAKVQRLELDILDSVKELTDQEAAASGDFEAAGKSLRTLVGAYQDLSENRDDAMRKHDNAVEAAAQDGLATPALVIGYPANEKALKALSDAGKNINDLGERLMKVSKARLALLNAWEKLESVKAGK